MFASLTLLVAAGLIGPLLAAGRRPLAPVLVGELVAGALLGRTGFGILDPTAQPFPAFMSLGFAMLMLGAGTEVDVRSPELLGSIRRGALALLVASLLSVPAGLAIGSLPITGRPLLFMVLLAGSSAAVAFPTIQERGLSGPAVAILIGWITLADALTALLMPLTLTGAGKVPLAVAGDLAIIALAAGVVLPAKWLFAQDVAQEARRESKHRHWALQLRISVLFLLVLAAIAERTGASLLVAGFAAGMVLRQFHEPHRLVHQLTGLATGFFVPAFFVLLGSGLDLRGLVHSGQAIVLAVVMAAAATLVHLAAALVTGRQARVASGLVASAQLGLPAAAAALGMAGHLLAPAVAAALVAGGALTLIPASLGARMLAASEPASPPVEPAEAPA